MGLAESMGYRFEFEPAVKYDTIALMYGNGPGGSFRLL